MERKIITLTETELKELIKESIREVFGKPDGDDLCIEKYGIDISNVGINVLRDAYKDLRLHKIPASFDRLTFPIAIKEAYGDILQPDEVVKRIVRKYGYSTDLVKKVEMYHQVAVYVVVAKMGENVELIKEDMERMGYFLGFIGKPVTIEGMEFVELKFEPYCQMRDDRTDAIKSNNKFLYHWTPAYNLESVRANGLVPSHKNQYFNYPPRIYLIEESFSEGEIIGLGQSLCLSNKDSRNEGAYVLLAIDTTKLGESIRLFYDPNSVVGVYTEQAIPITAIGEAGRQTFPTSFKKK